MTISTQSRLAADARAICLLALPLIGTNLSIIGMQFADTVMAGQLGARDLAALAVGVGFYHLFLLIGLGTLMAVSPEILPTAVGYVHAMAWGMPALLGFLALRYTTEGLGRTKPIMYFGFLGLTANVIGNWIFMYGKFGMPQLGAIGCGVATAISEWLMFFAMLTYMRRHRAYRPFDFFARIDPPDS